MCPATLCNERLSLLQVEESVAECSGILVIKVLSRKDIVVTSSYSEDLEQVGGN